MVTIPPIYFLATINGGGTGSRDMDIDLDTENNSSSIVILEPHITYHVNVNKNDKMEIFPGRFEISYNEFLIMELDNERSVSFNYLRSIEI